MLRDGEGQGSLVCFSPWGHKKLDSTKPLNNNNNSIFLSLHYLIHGTGLRTPGEGQATPAAPSLGTLSCSYLHIVLMGHNPDHSGANWHPSVQSQARPQAWILNGDWQDGKWRNWVILETSMNSRYFTFIVSYFPSWKITIAIIIQTFILWLYLHKHEYINVLY